MLKSIITLKVGGYTLMNKGEIKAVHDDDLQVFLKSLGVYDDVQNRKYQCHYCGKIIDLDNLQCVFPHDGKVCFCCAEEECYRMMLSGGKMDV